METYTIKLTKDGWYRITKMGRAIADPYMMKKIGVWNLFITRTEAMKALKDFKLV